MFNRKLFALVLGGVIGSSVVNAAEHTGYAGALVGGQSITKGGGTGFALGGDVGFFVTEEIGIGAYITWRKKTVDEVSTTNLPFGIQANYWWKDVAPGLYTGVRAGMARTAAAGESTMPFSFGLAVGYDYAVASNFTVGAQGTWDFVLSKDEAPSYQSFVYGVTGKFWF